MGSQDLEASPERLALPDHRVHPVCPASKDMQENQALTENRVSKARRVRGGQEDLTDLQDSMADPDLKD